jgi:hypothetical protein
MVVHQLYEAERSRAPAQELRDEKAPNLRAREQVSWRWLIWLIVRLCCLLAALILSVATLTALIFFLISPRSSARHRLEGLFHSLIHSLIGIFLPSLAIALLLMAHGWVRSAIRATALGALLNR